MIHSPRTPISVAEVPAPDIACVKIAHDAVLVSTVVELLSLAMPRTRKQDTLGVVALSEPAAAPSLASVLVATSASRLLADMVYSLADIPEAPIDDPVKVAVMVPPLFNCVRARVNQIEEQA